MTLRELIHPWSVFAILAITGAANAQVVISEIMHSPAGNDSLWEWIEILNTSGQPVNLNGWVFDDDDNAAVAAANISSAGGTRNTIVPAGGIAVLYPGNPFGFNPQRFANAWGAGITFIGVDGFTALTSTDSIGLWPNHAAYASDTIPGATNSPRRNFANAAAAIDYSTGFPEAEIGRSLYWNGIAPVSGAANWNESQSGLDNAFATLPTTIDGAPINSTSDRGNPGRLPPGTVSPGLRITEIMFAPDSPVATVGYAEADFEWVEIFNNTGLSINFDQQHHVFDDNDGTNLETANITTGSLAPGALGILFNNDRISLEQMQTIWGSDLNYIPVADWPSLNNTGGDTIAIWQSHSDYNSEPGVDSERTHENAIASVTYDVAAGDGWPTLNDQSSIYLNDLDGDPNSGTSWRRAGASGDTISSTASPIFAEVTDYPGGDVGSPGFAPGALQPVLHGDFNDDGVVNAADYVAWRKRLGSISNLPNDPHAGTVVDNDQYIVWRNKFGVAAAGSGQIADARAPEPGIATLIIAAASSMALRPRGRNRLVLL